MTMAPERHAAAQLSSPGPSPSHVGVRVALLAGAAAIVAMWWLDPSPLHGAGAAVTAAGRLAGLLGAYLVLVQLLLMGRIAVSTAAGNWSLPSMDFVLWVRTRGRT